MKKKILYIDDEIINLELFEINFKNEFEIYVAESPLEGLKIVQNNSISVVITDYKMPEINGNELIQKIKEFNPHIVCIMLSGFLESAIAKNSELVFEYIMKPYKKEELRSAIIRAFEYTNL